MDGAKERLLMAQSSLITFDCNLLKIDIKNRFFFGGKNETVS